MLLRSVIAPCGQRPSDGIVADQVGAVFDEHGRAQIVGPGAARERDAAMTAGIIAKDDERAMDEDDDVEDEDTVDA